MMLHDLRFGLRTLSRSPGLAAAAVLVMGLGIGANATIFSLVNAVLLRPLPAAKPDELVRLQGIGPDGGQQTTSYPDYADYRDQNEVFTGLAASSLIPVSLGGGDHAEQLLGEIVSGNYFSVLGVRPASGRIFLPAEDRPGADRIVVISHGLWRRRFASDPGVIGRTLVLNGGSFNVVGIAPQEFTGTFAGVFIDLWVPLQQAGSWLGPQWLSDRDSGGLRLIGRLKPGISLELAQTSLSALAARLAQDDPESRRGEGVVVSPATVLHGSLRGSVSAFLAIVMGVVGVVLLTACANLAGLLLVRAAGRRREMAIRLALGATRSRLARQVLTESLLLASLGGLAGVLLAVWTSQLMNLFNPLPPSIPIRFDLSPDARVLGFTLGLSLLSGLMVGVAPAFQATRSDPAPALKDESGSLAGGPHRSRLRGVFVISQVAMSVILLIGAGLFLRSLRKARGIEPGFEPENALAIDIDLQSRAYSREQAERFYGEAIRRIAALPGVLSATVADLAPLDLATQTTGVVIEGQEPGPGRGSLLVSFNRIGSSYFETLRIPLLGGRDFTERDDAGRPGVVIINETMARRFWPGEDPVGRRFRLAGDERRGLAASSVEVIGVAANVKYRTLGEDPQPHLYLPYRQNYDFARTLLVRTGRDPGGTIPAVQRELRGLDQEGFFARTLVQHAGLSLLPARMAATLSAAFGTLTLLLAVVGVYGIVSYSVTQRTREIGVRMALGARPADLLRLVLGQGLKLIATGVAAGLAGAFLLTRFLSTLLYGVSPTDPLTFAGVALLLAGIALLATCVPARRAARLDPMVALRHE
jgi:putative ABC transport system permease protein